MEVLDVQISCENLQKNTKKLPKLIPSIRVYPEHKRPQSHLATFQMSQPPCRSGKSKKIMKKYFNVVKIHQTGNDDKLYYLSSELKRVRAKANAVHGVISKLKSSLFSH